MQPVVGLEQNQPETAFSLFGLSKKRVPIALFVVACVVASYPVLASAQASFNSTSENEAFISQDGAKTTYPAKYFDQFDPLTLEDMIERISGVSIADSTSNGERRGLRGTQDAILINGQQLIGKDNDASSALTQILASQVQYVEIMRGSSREVQSTTQRIINVVLTEDAQSVMQVQAALLWYDGDDSVRFNPTLIYSAKNERNNYSVFFRSVQNARPWARNKLTADLTGLPVLNCEKTEQLAPHKMRTIGRFEQNFESGSRLQLNSYIEGELIDRERREVEENPQSIGGPIRFSDMLEADERDIWTAELSVDYSRPLGQGDSFTFLGFFNWEEEKRDREVFDQFGPIDTVVTSQARQDVKTESVFRATYDWTESPKLDAQIGAEGTSNTQKTDFELLNRIGGELVPQPVFNSNGKVTEYRGELFSTARWRLTGNLSSEIGMAVEASRISQASDDVDSSRFLSYVKPSFSTFWNVTPSDRLYLSVVRDVQQLNFLEFVATITDRDQELEAGNPDLRPEKSWDASIGYEHGLDNGAGLLTLSGFYRHVDDVSGRVLFVQDSITKPGNIGSGSEVGAEVELSLQFTRLGWWDGILTTSYLYRDTSVTDPFSGLERSFDQNPNWEFNITYRHDVDTLIDGYIDFIYSKNGQNQIYDFDYIESINEAGQFRITVTHQIRKNLELKATARNIINNGRIRRDRLLFGLNNDNDRVPIGSRFEQHEWGKFFNVVLNWNV